MDKQLSHRQKDFSTAADSDCVTLSPISRLAHTAAPVIEVPQGHSSLNVLHRPIRALSDEDY